MEVKIDLHFLVPTNKRIISQIAPIRSFNGKSKRTGMANSLSYSVLWPVE